MNNEVSSEGPPLKARAAVIALLLAVLTAALYGRAVNFDFVNIDDPSYVYRNDVVARGLSSDSVSYAFRGEHSTNWHPLTTLSHMLDVELFGMDAGKHHAVSIGLHALNAALCFLAFFALTRRMWVSALIAALFALHPARVESVAWVSERKDVLSGTFFFLTLLAWVRYVRTKSTLNYVWVAVALALGLLSKQMLITVPFLLVILDIWPLRRNATEDRSVLALLREKLPLMALSFGAAALMWIAQDTGGTIGSLSITARLANALGAVLAYVEMFFAPRGLACFYPHPSIVTPGDWTPLLIPAAIGAVLVTAVTMATMKLRRAEPALVAGWLWFLGTLVPVIGLVQIGSQSHADRYTYLPAIGLAWMLAAGAARLAEARPALRMPLIALALAGMASLSLLTWRQVAVWENSETLNLHAIAVTEKNYVAHNNLGLSHLQDDLDAIQAEEEFMAALEINPSYREAVFNLALSYNGQGRALDAIATLERLLVMDPTNAPAARQLGSLKRQRGDTEAALANLRRATELNPADTGAWVELGHLYLALNEGTYAEQCGERVSELAPDSAAGPILLGLSTQQLDAPAIAVTHFERAVEVEPQSYEARHNLARQLADMGALKKATEHILAALALPQARPNGHILLAKLHLAKGDADIAIEELDLVLADDPNHAEANDVLGIIHAGQGKFVEAEAAYRAALFTKASYAPALANLGALLEQRKRENEAIEFYARLLDSDVESSYATNAARGLAWILATSPDDSLHDGTTAVRWADFVLKRTSPNDPSPNPLIVFAAAKARAGQFDHAIELQRAAIERATSPAQKKSLEAHLALYEAGQPLTRAK